MSAPPIAFIGVGNIGSRMAARLINAGHPVTVYDPTETAVAVLVEEGATAATDPPAAADGTDFVLLSLPNPAILDTAVSELPDLLSPEVILVDLKQGSTNGNH